MISLVTAVGVVGASCSGHEHDGGEGATAVFTGVLGFLTALVEFVTTSVAAVGMACTGGADELPDVSEAVTAVFAIVVCHSMSLFRVGVVSPSEWLDFCGYRFSHLNIINRNRRETPPVHCNGHRQTP